MDGKDLKTVILETVDHIVKRKTRPDSEKICHVVSKKTKLDKDEVKDELEALVKKDFLFKLIHKGIVSYRCKQSPRTIRYSMMTENNEGSRTSSPELLLKKEIKTEDEEESAKVPKSRPVGRPRKHPKLEDEATKTAGPPKKRGRPKLQRRSPSPPAPESPSSNQSGAAKPEASPLPPISASCDTCHAVLNKEGNFEELLICAKCKLKVHPACINFSIELAIRCQRFPWHCADCKLCFLCNKSSNEKELLLCGTCDRGYHLTCHNPPVTQKPTGSWRCHGCYLEDFHGLSHTRIASAQKMAYESSLSLTPSSSPKSSDESEMGRMLRNYPNVVPKIDTWSEEDVHTFFQAQGFNEEARILRDQEIDGKSLLLLSRNDVITGMSFRLGPALKIYNHIKRLQSGLPNGHLL